jgi:hypothetical protein
MIGVEGLGRPVTKAEAQVLSVLFESSIGSEEGRIRRSGLSRTTFQVAKKRLYETRSVADRYLPNPAAFGFRAATFVLATPFAEHLPSASKILVEEPGSVVVWLGRQSVLGVLFQRNMEEAKGTLDRINAQTGGRFFAVCADTGLPTVPCYFDFEGAWKKLSGQPGVAGYPRPLGGPFASGIFGGGPRPADIDAARRLVHDAVFSEQSNNAPHLLGPHLLPMSQRKLLNRNLVQWRVFPAITSFPTFPETSLNEVIFVTGRFHRGAKAAEFFGRLAGECRVFPFLYCTDGDKVILAALGTGQAAQKKGPGVAGPPSTMSTIKAHIEGISIIRETASALFVQHDHRYDRLFHLDMTGDKANGTVRPKPGA